MVDIVADTESLEKKTEEFYKQFNVVCLTDCPADVQVNMS